MTGGNLLEGLESVRWAELHHAYGSAEDVPAQLRALSSANVEERRRARHELGGNVYHQGTRWQASCHGIPFLARLAEDPATPDRSAVVDLLRAVAHGDRDDTHLPFAPDHVFAAAEAVTGPYAIQLTAAIALAFRLGDRMPEAGPPILIEARERAGEITTESLPIPWNRSLLGFASLALQRIGLTP